MRMIKKKLSGILAILLLIVLINSLYVSAITGSIGNARMVLYPEVNGITYTTIEKSILVKNVNNVSVNIELKTDEEGSKFIEIADNKFTLQSNEEKKAQFKVKVKKEGSYEGRINVFFTAIEGKEAGVVLSSTIIVIAKKEQDYQDDNNANDEEDSGVNVMTGGGVGLDNGNKISKGLIFLGISSVILLVILVVLIYMMTNKNKLKGAENKSDESKGSKLKRKKKNEE